MEKLAEALYALNPDTQMWDGDPFGFREALRRGESRAQLAMRQAKTLIMLGVVDEDTTTDLPDMWEIRRTFPTRN